jgi:hypothetical protein
VCEERSKLSKKKLYILTVHTHAKVVDGFQSRPLDMSLSTLHLKEEKTWTGIVRLLIHRRENLVDVPVRTFPG